jgi:RNA polymerase sigma factor for flagellar operon FliA
MTETQRTTHKLGPIEDYYQIVETTTNALWGSLAKKKVASLYNNIETKQDLYQEGMIALVECYTRYKEEKKVTFLTYALHRVRGKMLDYLRTKDTMSRTSRAKFNKIDRDFKNKLITEEEKNSKLHDINGVLTIEFQPLELNSEINDGLVHLPRGYDVSGHDSGCNEHEQTEIKHTVNKLIKITELSSKEKHVIVNYYFKEKNFKAISNELGVQESRISQLHISALNKLRQSMR